MDKKIIKNLIYNTSYQILVLLLPFITIPYVSRVFTPNDLGVYSSTYANVSLFCIMGMFAINSYGTRVVAKSRNDKNLLSIKYKELRCMQIVTTGIALLFYALIFVVFNKNNKDIYLLQGINILAFMVDISWLYMGVEDFKKTVIRNTFVKIISIIMIFTLVKDSSDLNVYILIIACSSLFGNLAMWKYKSSIVDNVKIEKINLIKNMKESFFLLVPVFFFQIYTSFDRSILANVSSMSEVGMFDQSQKIIRIAVSIVTSLGIVMLPRVASMISEKASKKEINDILKKSINLTLFISCASSFGLLAISKNFIPWFYGEGYSDVFILINITSVVCILTALGSFFSNQYAIPSDNKKAYIIPIVSGAITSVLLNCILGAKYGAFGAAITIVIVEFLALILRIVFLRKDLDIKYLFSDLYKYFISGLIMYIIVKILSVNLQLPPNMISTFIEVLIGGIVYIVISLILNRKKFNVLKNKVLVKLQKVER